jgi:hypothetical protein
LLREESPFWTFGARTSIAPVPFLCDAVVAVVVVVVVKQRLSIPNDWVKKDMLVIVDIHVRIPISTIQGNTRRMVPSRLNRLPSVRNQIIASVCNSSWFYFISVAEIEELENEYYMMALRFGTL